MTPCAKGDEAETEEIFLPIQKKREKSIARKIKEIATVLKAKRKQNRENKRQKSNMKKKLHIVCKHYYS